MNSLRLLILSISLILFITLLTSYSETSKAILKITINDARDLPTPGFMDLNSVNMLFLNKTKVLKVIVKYYNILPIKFINTNINVYIRNIELKYPILIINMTNDKGYLKIIFHNQSFLLNASRYYFKNKQVVSEYNLTCLPFNITKGKYLVSIRSEVITWDVFDDVLFYKPGGVTRVIVDGEPYDWLFTRFLTLYGEGRDTYYGVRNEGLDMDYGAVLLTDNSTHIILRVDPIEEPTLNPNIIRKVMLLIDIDSNSSTGYLNNGLGFDYYADIRYIASSRKNITAILNLYKWNNYKNKFEKVLNNIRFTLNKFKVIEGAIPLQEMKVNRRIRLKIWVDNIAIDEVKKVIYVD